MRRYAYALMASLALMFGAATQASAGCYGGDCDVGYRSSYGPPAYESYSGGPAYYGERSYYGGRRYSSGYYDDGYYDDGYRSSSCGGYGCGGGGVTTYVSCRGDCDYAMGGGYGYSSGYGGYGDGCGYGGCGYSRYSSCGYGYGGCGYRRYYSSCGYGYGCGGYRYSGCGYGYGCGGYGYGEVRLGGGWSQTLPALASGYGYGGGYGWGGGCRVAYIPYGWSWYRAASC